jgi:hypothetical protein
MAGSVSVASQPPVRTPSGGTTDQIFQPLADCGNGNPAFYHQYFDDFDQATSFSTTANVTPYTVGGASATFTAVAGSGGIGQLALEAVANEAAQIQVVRGTFAQNIAPKKLFYETRMTNRSNPATTNLVLGLVDVANPVFTIGTGVPLVTDGIYIAYIGATNVMTLNQAVGSVVTSVTIPPSAYVGMTTGTNQFDFALYQARNGDILAYVDTQLVGFVPQSNIGTLNNPQNAGAVARILGTSYTATAVALTPTIAIWSSTASANANFDFLTAEQER